MTENPSPTPFGALSEQTLRERAATYALFARIFARELDAGLLAALGADPFGAADCEPADPDPDALLTELAVDFARLFVVRGRDTRDAAYPFESVYASTEGLTSSDARADVRRRYRAAGLAPDEGWTVGEDHIALELQFLQLLCERAADAVAAGDRAGAAALAAEQAAFLDDHLLRWAPRFADAVERDARTALYRGAARQLKDFLSEDRALLQARVL